MSDTDTATLKLNPKETAMIFIEYQNEFTTEGGALYDAVKDCMEATKTLENSKALLEAARTAGCTVIHVPIVFDEGHSEISDKPYGILAGIKEGEIFKNGTWGAEFCDSMKPISSDIIAAGKRGLCGFATTNLDFILRQNGCKNIILSGFLTNCCVESTMRSGYELGYKVYTVKDCCAATSMDGQNAAYEHTFGMFSNPSTSADIIDAIKTA
jgi:nicotinamidase-related amidase